MVVGEKGVNMNNPLAPGIIDNTPDRELVKVIRDQIRRSKEAKFAIGYFFLNAHSLLFT